MAHTFSSGDFAFTDAGIRRASHLSQLLKAQKRKLTLDGKDVDLGKPILAGDVFKLAYAPDKDESGAEYASFIFSRQDSGGQSSQQHTILIRFEIQNHAKQF